MRGDEQSVTNSGKLFLR